MFVYVCVCMYVCILTVSDGAIPKDPYNDFGSRSRKISTFEKCLHVYVCLFA